MARPKFSEAIWDGGTNETQEAEGRMKARNKRIWSDEQRAAAGDRMRLMVARRQEAKRAAGATVEDYGVVEAERGGDRMPSDPKYRESYPNAVEDKPLLVGEDPLRVAKLQMIHARNLTNLAQTAEGRDAIARMEARKNGSVLLVEKPQAIKQLNVEIAAALELDKPTPAPVIPPITQTPFVRDVPLKVPFRLTGSQSGQMISELGDCVCGEKKLKWHAICLKVKVYA
jgi:hypothetical protein